MARLHGVGGMAQLVVPGEPMPFTSVWKSCLIALTLGATTVTGAQSTFGSGTLLVGVDVARGLYSAESAGRSRYGARLSCRAVGQTINESVRILARPYSRSTQCSDFSRK